MRIPLGPPLQEGEKAADGRLGKQEVSFTLMYGFATGNTPVLERIVKPAP